jgi:hypothetical protein
MAVLNLKVLIPRQLTESGICFEGALSSKWVVGEAVEMDTRLDRMVDLKMKSILNGRLERVTEKGGDGKETEDDRRSGRKK